MTVSVVVCTRNRASLLADCLEALDAQDVPVDLEWELVVVDNGSTDRTTAVVADAASHLPVRRVVEPRPGLAAARNRGVAEARGSYLAWTDDDALPDRRWLRSYVDAFQRHPDAAFLGGPIHPRFEGDPPAWLVKAGATVGGVYGQRDLGPVERALTLEWPHVPYGGNYAIRAAEQRAHPYDERLGRTPQGGLGNEETMVMKAILRSGGTGWWVPEASVVHRIPPSHQTVAYLRRYYEGEGRFQEWLARGPRGPERPYEITRLLTAAIRAEARYRVSRTLRPSSSWVPALVAAAEAWGRWRGRRGQARPK